MLISVAIPCYKSSKTVSTVVAGIQNAFSKHLEYSYQIILVNDGSPDNGDTLRVIEALCSSDKRIVGVDLGRNYGQSAARMAALPFVKGDILVNIDDDGQHNPEDIFKLVQAVENGADLAYASFTGKKHTLFKRFTSWLNGEILRITLQKPKDIHTSSFVAMSRYMIDVLSNYRSPFISFLGIALQYTTRIVNIPIIHHERLSGHSGYTLGKLFHLFGDGLFSFSIAPLRLLILLSGGSFLASMVFFVVSIIMTCLNHSAFLFVILGCIFACCGFLQLGQALISEYLGRSCMIQNQLPQYSIRQVFNDNTAS